MRNTKNYGIPKHAEYFVWSCATGISTKGDTIPMDDISALLAYDGNNIKFVNDVKVTSDNIYIKHVIGSQSKHLQFKIDGRNDIFVSHYPSTLFAKTEQNIKRAKQIWTIREQMDKMQKRISLLMHQALLDSYEYN